MDTTTTAVVFHAADWDETVPTRGVAPGPDWSVWNAPRPLVGQHTWTGPFRHGIFYAAVVRNADHDRFAQLNIRDDAYPVELVTDQQIVAAVRAYAEDNGYTAEMCADLGIELSELAAELNLPWRDSTTEAAR